MRKTNKKGFTIVELVIVIAVVAILAAVLIPTFVSVTKRANESKDTQLVRNLNTALAVDTEVGKHETMQSALEAAAKAGYDVAKINASATDNEILWDSKNDCFVYKKDSGIEYIPNSKTEEATDGDFWKIVADASAAAANIKYNSYVMGAAELGDMTVANGLDVGENTLKGTITFESNETKTVTIRTNGGTLTVNAPNATVKHYGKADKITITAVAPHSYHEYGEVTLVVLKKGHVFAENGSSIFQINIPDDVDVSVVKIDIDTNASVTAVTTRKALSDGTINIKNSDTAYIIKEENNYAVYVGKNGYNSLKEAITTAVSGQTIMLMKDCKETGDFSTILSGKELVIDLNGNKMTFGRYNLDVENGTQNTAEKLTFIDSGLTKGQMICEGTIAVLMGPNDSVVLDGVDLQCSMYGLYPRGNAAKLEIRNSRVKASVYSVATNASTTANGGVVILIDGSTIETNSKDQDNTAVQINVDSNVLIRNSTIKGERQALMLRGGVAVLENCVIEKTGTKNSSDYSDYDNEDKAWGDGNRVPAYALVLGNRSEAYQYPTNVTIENVTVKGGIYSWGNSTAGLETTIIFNGNNSGTLTIGENVKVIGKI